MAATIKIKNSSTAGAAPTSSDLVQGELAVNVTDKRLYTENSGGTIVELGTNPSVPVTFPDGSASAPSLTNDGDTNTGMFFPAADTIALTTGGSERLRLDSSGNLGLGVTPSAWSIRALQVGSGYAAWSSGITNARTFANTYYDGSYKYMGTGRATQYEQDGYHAWYTSASGTAGNAITFTQAMTLDASGNLLVGATTSNGKLTLKNPSAGSEQVMLAIQAASSTSAVGRITYDQTVDTLRFTNMSSFSGSSVRFGNNGLDQVMIDLSGNLLVGTTSTGFANDNGWSKEGTSVTQRHVNGTASGTAYTYFIYNGSAIGSISQNGTTGVLYNLTSDYRLKNDQQPLTGAKEFVMALQPKKWQWWDGSGEGVGFIAHEFMEVAKYSGHGEKDAVDEEGNIIPQSIQPSSSEVIANLVALLQEQQAIIESLTARITALEA